MGNFLAMGSEPAFVGCKTLFWATRRPPNEPEWVQIQATCQVVADGVSIYVEDSLWGSHVDAPRLSQLARDLLEETPEGSLDRGRGIIPLERDLFGRPGQPIRVLLTSGADNSMGYFSIFDTLSELEAQKLGGHSNGLPTLYLNAAQRKKPLAEVASHELQHLLEHQYDPGEKRWVRELLAESAMLLTGHPDVDHESRLVGRLGMPLITEDEEEANYPALASFARFLVERLGAGFLSRLNADPYHGVESFDRLLAPESSFRQLWKEWLISSFLKEQVRGYPDLRDGLLLLELEPSEAVFLRIPHQSAAHLTFEGLEEGFVELLNRNGECRSLKSPARLEACKDRVLVVASLKPCQVRLRLRCQGVSPVVRPEGPFKVTFGSMVVRLKTRAPRACPFASEQLEAIVAAAPARKIPQALPSTAQAVLDAGFVLSTLLEPGREADFLSLLALFGDAWTALAAIETLQAVTPATRPQVLATFREGLRLSYRRRDAQGPHRYSDRESAGRFLGSLVLFSSQLQPNECWETYYGRIQPAWSVAMENPAARGELGVIRSFRALCSGRRATESVSEAALRYQDFLDRMRELGYTTPAAVAIYQETGRLDPEGCWAWLRQGRRLPEEVAAELVHLGWPAGVHPDWLRLALARQGNSISTILLRRELERQLQAGRWENEAREPLLRELRRQTEYHRLLGRDGFQARQAAFEGLAQKLSPEQLTSTVEIDEGEVLVGGAYIPLHS